MPIPAAVLQAWAIAVGGMSSLATALIVLILLNRKRGPGAAFAFGLAYFGGYVLIGLTGVFVGASVLELDLSTGPSPTTAGVTLGLGLLLSAASVRVWRKPPASLGSEDDESFLGQVFATLDELPVARALGFGAALPVLNVKNLAIYLPAVALLASAELTPTGRVLAVVSSAAIFSGGLLIPLLIRVLFPRRCADWLAAMRRWIEAHATRVAQVILPCIAVALLARGGWSFWQIYA